MLQHINQLKQVLPSLSIEEQRIDDEKKYSVNAKSNFAVLSGSLITSKIKGLKETAYLDSYLYHANISLVAINLEEDELLEEVDISLNIQGNLNQSTIIVKDVRYIEEECNRFDYLCDFTK